MDSLTRNLLPEGLEDRLAPASAAASRVTRSIMDVLDQHGYDRVQPPSIEFETSLVSHMAGTSHTDASRRLCRFIDPVSLRMMALRNDLTPQVGRIAATRLADAARPLRLAYIGQVLTIKGDGLDPSRERLQLGAELIGSDQVAAAAEIVEVALEALVAAGARKLSVDFTLPDLVDSLAARAWPLAPDVLEAVRRELDAKNAGGLVTAGGEAYLPLLYAAGSFASALEKLSCLAVGGVLDARIAALKKIASRVNGNARLTLDPTERHGFEYQSWFGFSIYAEGLRDALGRGGTYRIRANDKAHTGDVALSDGETATGFSLYPDPLIDRLASSELRRDTLFLPLGHDSSVAGAWRARGWRTIMALAGDDDAVKLGCTHRLDGSEPVKLALEGLLP